MVFTGCWSNEGDHSLTVSPTMSWTFSLQSRQYQVFYYTTKNRQCNKFPRREAKEHQKQLLEMHQKGEILCSVITEVALVIICMLQPLLGDVTLQWINTKLSPIEDVEYSISHIHMVRSADQGHSNLPWGYLYTIYFSQTHSHYCPPSFWMPSFQLVLLLLLCLLLLSTGHN